MEGSRLGPMAYAGGADGQQDPADRQGWATGRLPPIVLPSLSIELALLIVSALTLWRIATLSLDSTDLFVDEAQYWLWSQNLDFGYYSKPPMIAWVLRLTAWLSGSTGSFGIRVCGPLFHCATSLVLMQAANRLFDRQIAAWTAVSYITLPGVALSSVFFSTDVVLLFFLALALYAYLLLTEKRSVPMAIVLGLAVAGAFLSKYAILFVVPGGLAAVALLPEARLSWRDFGLSVAVALLGSFPNLLWNLNNRMITVTHTASIAHWNQLQPHLLGGLQFFGAQFGIVGPIIFAAMLLAVYRAARRGCDWRAQLLIWLSIPVIVLICCQATIAKAYANWAVTAYVAGTVLAVWTLRSVWPQGLRWSLLLNGTISCLVALMPVYAHQLSADGATGIIDRYLGRSQVSDDAARLARELSLTDIVSDNRDILADMFYTLRGTEFKIYARVGGAAPQSYYEQMFPVPRTTTAGRPVLFVATHPQACRSGGEVPARTWQPQSGNYRGKTIYAYRLDSACLTAL